MGELTPPPHSLIRPLSLSLSLSRESPPLLTFVLVQNQALVVRAAVARRVPAPAANAPASKKGPCSNRPARGGKGDDHAVADGGVVGFLRQGKKIRDETSNETGYGTRIGPARRFFSMGIYCKHILEKGNLVGRGGRGRAEKVVFLMVNSDCSSERERERFSLGTFVS